MTKPLFNTLEMYRTLTGGDFTEKQATTLLDSFNSLLRDGVATSADIEKLETDIDIKLEKLDHKIDAAVAGLDRKIDAARTALSSDIEKLDRKIDQAMLQTHLLISQTTNRLLVSMTGMMIATVTIGIAVARYFGVLH